MEQAIKLHNFDLSLFKKSQLDMIATNDKAYGSIYGSLTPRIVTKSYTLEEINKIIENGSVAAQRALSNAYFQKDGHYRQLVIYYATLLKYAGILIPNPSAGKNLSTSHIQKRYQQAIEYIDKMNVGPTLTEWARKILINGCYYGIILESDKKSFAVLDLPIGYCTTRFKDFYGNDIIEFNISYFDTIADESKRNKVLKLYPSVVSKAYRRKDRTKNPWVVIPPDVGICFPMFDEKPYFLSAIPSMLQYDDAVETDLERDKEEIRKILIQKIPHLNDGRLLFEPEEAVEMHAGAVGMVRNNKNTSVLTTYADVDVATSKASNDSTSSSLERMQQNVYSKAGVSGEIFAATGGNTTETSIKFDIAIMMYLANKFSNFITNLINQKFANSNINFKYTILPISYQNEAKYVDSAYKLAGSGYSLIVPAIAQGFTQKDLINLKDLENDALKLVDKLIPPRTSFNSGSAGEEVGGRPTKEVDEKKEQTLRNEESIEKSKTQGGSE